MTTTRLLSVHPDAAAAARSVWDGDREFLDELVAQAPAHDELWLMRVINLALAGRGSPLRIEKVVTRSPHPQRPWGVVAPAAKKENASSRNGP